MASIWKHPRSKFWSACIRLPDGKRTKRSTKETDRKKAQAIADKFEGLARGQTTAIQARRVVADIHKLATGEELSQFTVRDYLDRWVTSKKPEIDAGTAEKYRATTNEFLGFIGDKADKDLLRVTLDDLHGFRDHISQQSSPKTANNKLTIIAQPFRTAWKDSHLPDDIAGRVRKLKLKGKQQKRLPFTIEQVRKIFETTKGEWTGIVLFGYYTGQRLGDIATLTWDNIDHAQKTLNLVSQKQQRTTCIPLAPPLHAWIAANTDKRQANTSLFPKSKSTITNNAGKVSALSKQFHKILVECGLSEKREWKSQGKGREARRTLNQLSFHSFRHTLTSTLKSLGSGAAVTKDIVGHDSTVVSDQYTHVNDDEKRRYIEKLPDIRGTVENQPGKRRAKR